MADLDALRTFIAAVRTGSFAQAARQLHLSPAMVGRRIAGLEQRHGIKLIERTTRSQRLTELGHDFLVRAEAVIEAADALDYVGSSDGALSGRIRISAPTTLGIRKMPAIITRFAAAHPGVVFEMSLSDRRVDLIAEGFDVAVRVGHLPSSSLVARRVGTYRLICCATPDFLARHGAINHPTDLERTRCVLNLNLVPRNRWIFIGLDDAPLTVEPRGSIEIDNGEAQRTAALGGGGVVYLPFDLVEDDIAEGRLVHVLPGWGQPSLPIHTVHPSRNLVPKRVNAFIDAVAESFRDSYSSAASTSLP